MGQSGEWVNAWLWMSITFLVGALGVTGLGWWVLRGDRLNRTGESRHEPPADKEHPEPHH